MEIMEGVHLYLLLLLVTLIQGIQSQAITPSSVFVAVDDDVSLECTAITTADPYSFTWTHITSTATEVIYGGGIKIPPRGSYDNFELDEDITAKRSTLIINIILRQDAGQYRCTISGEGTQDPATVTVEVGSLPEEPDTPEPIALTSIEDNSNPAVDNSNPMYMYQATYEVIGTSPEETIAWILDGVNQTDGIVETDPGMSDDSLFDKKSVFTFPATPENYNVTLQCNIGGHQVAKLNRQVTRLVDIHKRPQSGDIKIEFARARAELTVSCDDTDSAAIPAMSTFNIYSNGTLITKLDSESSVTVTEPEQDTEFRCEGSNYLGSTDTTRMFYSGSTTTPTPTTTAALETATSKVGNKTGSGGTAEPPVKVAAIVGGVVGAIVVIVIIVIAVCYCKKEERFCFEAGGPKSSGSSKPAGSAVGSSNGSEREKTKPEAAPRGHGSIQHTNDNPNQDMYAMVDKKPSGGRGGDAPDRGSGPGQNEPQGMLYADLDLSHKAGHTDKHVPKNENDVVVYSSILV